MSPLAGEARETSGITSTLLLSYLDRVGGADATNEVLRRCGLERAEALLRDENCWFSWETKIRLFEATAAVLEKPDYLEEMASLALDLGVGGGLKVALRTLGSPQIVYRSVVRANARFNGSHVMELLGIAPSRATISFADIAGRRRYHPLDCQYSAVMLQLIPELFGLPKAQLRHVACVGSGDDACVYELHWRDHVAAARRAVGTAAGAAVVLTASSVFAPALLPAAIGLAIASGGALAVTEIRRLRRSWHNLRREADDHAEVAQRLLASMQDLVSDLRLEEVLSKVTRNAQAAVGGREFALLVRDGEQVSCQSSSGLPAGTIAALEAWACGHPQAADQCLVVDDVATVPALRRLGDPPMPLCSLASAPLTFFGEQFGLLVALGTQSRTFLPRDVDVLQSFASQVSIALHNARRYHLTKSQADLDALTGLGNHRSFHDALESALDRPGSDCVVLIDLDHFKRINDEDGHGAGDRVLHGAARVLESGCRADDLAFRIGGDEFALLLTGIEEPGAEEVAARVCAAIADLDPRLGASAGVARLERSTGKEAALEQADRLLYESKRAARGDSGVCVCGRRLWAQPE